MTIIWQRIWQEFDNDLYKSKIGTALEIMYDLFPVFDDRATKVYNGERSPFCHTKDLEASTR